MKRLLFLILCFPLFMNAQVQSHSAYEEDITDEELAALVSSIVVPTTKEEYTYATKGYLDDVSKGKDPVKNGYSFNQKHVYSTIDSWDRHIEIRFVEMEKIDCCVRALILAYYENSEIKKSYCVPIHQNSFKRILNNERKENLKQLSLAMADYLISTAIIK